MTNNLHDFEAYWEIDPVPLLGIASNVAISCTHRGKNALVTTNGNVIPMLMFYSLTTTSPNDAVATSDNFSTWTQHSDVNSRIGCVRFSSPTDLDSEHVDLRMSNNLWFLETPRCNVKKIPHLMLKPSIL